MASPLALYNKIAKDFNVTDKKLLHPRQQLAYVQEQANQQRAIVNRLLFDIAAKTDELDNAKDDATKAAYSKKIAEYQEDLRQLTKGLDFFIAAEEELSKTNPGLEAGAYPEA